MFGGHFDKNMTFAKVYFADGVTGHPRFTENGSQHIRFRNPHFCTHIDKQSSLAFRRAGPLCFWRELADCGLVLVFVAQAFRRPMFRSFLSAVLPLPRFAFALSGQGWRRIDRCGCSARFMPARLGTTILAGKTFARLKGWSLLKTFAWSGPPPCPIAMLGRFPAHWFRARPAVPSLQLM